MKYFVTNNGELLFSNGSTTCESCLRQCTDKEYCRLHCPENGEDRRFGSKIVKNNTLYICCTSASAKTTKLFKEKLEMLAYSVPQLMDFKTEIEKSIQKKEVEKYTKIVHNLKTLNAQSIMAIYRFIPQSVLSERYENVFDYVMNVVEDNKKEAVGLILKLAKFTSDMKTEFSTHEKLEMDNPLLAPHYHIIRTVVLNIYHTFDTEFKSKHVRFIIDNVNDSAYFDYETVRLALYHIFSNALKYTSEKSDLRVKIYTENNEVGVEFNMKSLYISPEEKDDIFNDHYSGAVATKRNLNGTGLGMGLIKKALTLNGGSIIVIPGSLIQGTEYGMNTFKLVLPSQERSH